MNGRMWKYSGSPDQRKIEYLVSPDERKSTQLRRMHKSSDLLKFRLFKKYFLQVISIDSLVNVRANILAQKLKFGGNAFIIQSHCLKKISLWFLHSLFTVSRIGLSQTNTPLSTSLHNSCFYVLHISFFLNIYYFLFSLFSKFLFFYSPFLLIYFCTISFLFLDITVKSLRWNNKKIQI